MPATLVDTIFGAIADAGSIPAVSTFQPLRRTAKPALRSGFSHAEGYGIDADRLLDQRAALLAAHRVAEVEKRER